MPALDAEYLTFHYNCEYRGVPGPDLDPGDFPIDWTVSVTGTDWSDEEDGRDEDVHVGGDLLVLSSTGVGPRFRGNRTGRPFWGPSGAAPPWSS